MTTSQQSANGDAQSSSQMEQWSEALAQRLQETITWLRQWGTPRTDVNGTGVEQAESHLWAEGPLPGELAVRLSREASEGESDHKSVARGESRTTGEDRHPASQHGRKTGTESSPKTLPKVTG